MKSPPKNPPKIFPTIREDQSIINYSDEATRVLRLRKLAEINFSLPEKARRSKYDILIDAGYSETKARSLSDILAENGKLINIKNKGFDENSAKLVISEIAHDEDIKPEVRLKAAEDMLKVLGIFREPGDSANTAGNILAQLLSDMFKASENKPKIAELINLE